MSTLIRGGWLVDVDPPLARRHDLRLDCGVVAAIDAKLKPQPGDEIVDAAGAVVLPGLVNGHTHLYSALAVGMPPPVRPPLTFQQILRSVWWRLDRALDLPLIEISATIGAIEALRCGTTTLIDHHASPGAVAGSLDAIEAGLAAVGVRGVLCYETTDRHGPQGRAAGLAENTRYLDKCERREDRQFAGMVGGHAAFTMGGDALESSAELARRYGVGVHMHLAEDLCDALICRERYGGEVVERLQRAGILSMPSILAHGTHLTDRDLTVINASPVTIAHNPRSNMNNAVGYAPVARLARSALLGTDGIGSDMFAELQTAWLQSRDHGAGLQLHECVAMLGASARRARRALRTDLGRFTIGAAADVVLTDYLPATPLDTDNVPAHLVFAVGSRHVRSVIVDGEWRLRDRQLSGVDEAALRRRASSEAARLWESMPGEE